MKPLALRRKSDGALFSYNEVVANIPGFEPVFSEDDIKAPKKTGGDSSPPSATAAPAPEDASSEEPNPLPTGEPDEEEDEEFDVSGATKLGWLEANKQMVRAARVKRAGEKGAPA